MSFDNKLSNGKDFITISKDVGSCICNQFDLAIREQVQEGEAINRLLIDLITPTHILEPLFARGGIKNRTLFVYTDDSLCNEIKDRIRKFVADIYFAPEEEIEKKTEDTIRGVSDLIIKCTISELEKAQYLGPLLSFSQQQGVPPLEITLEKRTRDVYASALSDDFLDETLIISIELQGQEDGITTNQAKGGGQIDKGMSFSQICKSMKAGILMEYIYLKEKRRGE